MIKIAPSTLPSSENHLVNYVMDLQKAGADYIHVDVMDGKFVPNKTLSVDLVEKLSFSTLLPVDIHLMVSSPLEYAKAYLKTKPNYITAHIEAFENKNEINQFIDYLHSNNIMVGLSIKPNTKVDMLVPYLSKIELVLPLSVEPGKGGQEFIENTYDKFVFLNEYRSSNGLSFKIEADGGVNHKNIDKVSECGVDIAVVGSAIYNAINKSEYINRLKKV